MVTRRLPLPSHLLPEGTDHAPVLDVYATEKEETERPRPYPRVGMKFIRELLLKFHVLEDIVRAIDSDGFIPARFYVKVECIKRALDALCTMPADPKNPPRKALVRVRVYVDAAARLLRGCYAGSLQEGRISQQGIDEIDTALGACLSAISPFPPGPSAVEAELSIWDSSRLSRILESGPSDAVSLSAVLTLVMSDSTGFHFHHSYLLQRPPPFVPLSARCVSTTLLETLLKNLKEKVDRGKLEEEVDPEIAPTVYGLLSEIIETVSTVVPYDSLAEGT